ncbi:MAG: RNA polymerase sigma factor [Bacteroidota bacterium]
MMNSQEKEIVRLLTSETGVNEGFQKLLDAYQKPLYFFVRRLLLSHDDTHDVLQDSFVRVLHGIHSFKGESQLSTWLHTIAYREALKHLKRKKKKNLVELNEEIWNYMEQLEEDIYYSGNRIQLILQACVAALPEKQRAVFVMKYYEEKKYDEIATITGTSVGALKASYYHAVEKIKATLEKQKLDWKEYETTTK